MKRESEQSLIQAHFVGCESFKSMAFSPHLRHNDGNSCHTRGHGVFTTRAQRDNAGVCSLGTDHSSGGGNRTVARALTLYETSIGKKAVMAVSGAVWLGFVFSHMAGNLLVFVGADAMNNYALSLREMGGGGLLWVARFVLLAAIAGHVWSALSLKRQNSSARPVAYKVKKDLASTPSSKTMMYGGYAILGFIIFHLLHLTLHVVGPVREVAFTTCTTTL